MTRRLAETLNTSRPRSPHILPIGHLSNKSSVYSPTSMSYMSQEFVYNHMKSHYQHIASAKACVDTSTPKSLKLTVKGRDRKRREFLQKSGQSTPARPSSRAWPRQNKESYKDSYEEEDSITGNTIGHQDLGHSKNLSVNGFRKSPSKTKEYGSSIRGSKSGLNSSWKHDFVPGERPLRANEQSDESSRPPCNDWVGDLRTGEFHDDSYRYTKHQRTKKLTRSGHISLTDGSGWEDVSSHDKHFGSSLMEPHFDRLHTSTPRFSRDSGQNEFFRNPSFQISNVSFSYKEPPSPRIRNRKNTGEIIWTEEQKYLAFINEVTTDILVRGIFSNRVLNRVFESHVEKRKDDLDEEHMREMIHQLKQDLNINDG